ncbi:secretory carrier-associated membrane protein 1-like [Poecile atricapillus]|uniref:secretory carrier-associated membrane protein 1-like n=1 Tax=Poecile atricapillus TaxID=48891 RepID=UPI0027386235|nr:secretory carrier-associated membrane protein 1-like [Poecile atricapillus]
MVLATWLLPAQAAGPVSALVLVAWLLTAPGWTLAAWPGRAIGKGTGRLHQEGAQPAPSPLLGVRKNNWPPLPENFPVRPCFYQDFSVDIPVEFQKTVKIMYYLWMFHTVTLFLNIFGCFAWFYIDATRGVDFGLSSLWFLLFTPCSFVCWYRPRYGAFRSDNSFRFFVFFFVYICHFAVHVLQAAGFQKWGNCGWILSLTSLIKSIPVGIMMTIIAALFTASAAISLVMIKKVHGLYSTTGAIFEKAQQEFATGVLSNKSVQTAAANATSTAATGAAQNVFKGMYVYTFSEWCGNQDVVHVLDDGRSRVAMTDRC